MLLTATVLALLTSCGDDTAATTGSSPPASGASASTASATPSVETTLTEPPATEQVASTKPRMRRASGAYDLVLEDVRVRQHGDGTRVVLTFAGSGRPGWSVRYVREAVLEGSGDVVDLAGDAVLRLDVTGTPTIPSDEIEPIATRTGGAVVDVHAVSPWEGSAQVFLGIEGGRVPFTVVDRADPARMVIDLG